MKLKLLGLMLCLPLIAQAQITKPEAITFSYFGDMITHPGIKIGLDYSIKTWEKDHSKNNSLTKSITKSWIISPNIAYYYHRRYQSGLLILPEIQYSRQNQKGNQLALGFGLGGLKTFVPNVYEPTPNGEVKKAKAGMGYFASSYFISFGKDLSAKSEIPLEYFIKPQFLLALPNFPNNTGYFFLELGLKYKLR
ncbi:hypothetical protein [Echinicola shivajiensis]|uniref:hypothetical protein n=1 Tax=Echinicola shivajiensis TaxID=1035916 RepID=UPI001BFC7A4A|nr:hypothetical protein [Echinicola shivajiensis]